MANQFESIAMETYARRSLNYLENMVDKNSLPYFNIFWDDPSEAAHDWPDFGDVMSRQLQGAIMSRLMTGLEASTEKIWLNKILSMIDPKTGLLTRPETNYSKRVAVPGDNSLTLYSLVTVYADSKDEQIRQIIYKMVDGLMAMTDKEGIPGGFLGGFAIKSLMACARTLNYEPALILSKRIVDTIFYSTPYFPPDNTFRHGGHMHGNLRSLVGVADYALYTNDPITYSRVDALYRYVKTEATSFGFLPEVIGRKGDIVPCETCAIMDYLGLAITLANHGHPEYWSNVERIARNHLIESQVTDGSWLVSDSSKPDTDQFTWQSIGERMIGGYAGWSSPNHILAARETLNAHWGGPELRDKTRAFQNCCGGSGNHAFFEVWKNSTRFERGCLSINLHLDKSLPQAEIRGYQPYCGLLTIKLKETCELKVRIPEFIRSFDIKATVNGNNIDGKVWGNFFELGTQKSGDEIRITYPIPISTEIITIGNPGFRQYKYQVTWKGDTVIRMESLDNEYLTGYSDFDNKQVPIYYGNEGPGKLYVRENYLEDKEPMQIKPTPLQVDNGVLDFWYFN